MADAYIEFMNEYLQLGHMRQLGDEEICSHTRPVNYIPHHGIWQWEDQSSKLRVVFNASRSTSTGYSLNDVLLTGPKLQTHLWRVLIRWRQYSVAFCADVKMMYRQIKIDDRDVDLQRIVWSPGESEPIQHFQLLTVTYGESCAPYLSLRVLQQLCINEGEQHKEAVNALTNERYIDDVLSGADNLQSALHLRDQIIQLLNAGGFPLRKWIANDPRLLQDLSPEECLRPSWIGICEEGPVTELGLLWHPQSDNLVLTSPVIIATQTTKREILSAIASVFDPFGWLAPVTVVAKLIMQDLWRARLDWDEELPASMARRCANFKEGLIHVSQVTLPRWIQSGPRRQIQLHAFSDASRRVMAAVVYVRAKAEDDQVSTALLAARTKLNSIKSLQPSLRSEPRMTIPRLELRAALLASKLLKAIADDLRVAVEDCFAWCDAQIVLHWIHSSIPVDNSLVDNYISHIQETMPSVIWRYVPTQMNPADIASRGTELVALLRDRSWFDGPDWLSGAPSTWPVTPPDLSSANAVQTLACVSAPRPTDLDLLAKFSELSVLLRFLVRVRRWIREKLQRAPALTVMSPTTAGELNDAFLACVALSQRRHFIMELESLKEGRGGLSRRSPLKGLDVFIDSGGVMRVGGRLQHSSLGYNERHPPILSGACPLARLVIAWAHQRSLHGGFRSTYVQVVRSAWITGGKRRIRTHIHHCVHCARTQARPLEQIMVPLPRERVNSIRAFTHTGLDYAGPFNVHAAKGRGSRTTKAYVAVFVCFASKGLHLEAVGDLTTESLQGALIRFFGRRGKPAEIWSDNATHFHRADLEMKQALRDIQWNQVAKSLATDGITWRFIPPAAPHFGGLWEAGVKSFKTHLKRIAGQKKLTYEEFSTLLVSIETVLNCRPLSPLSSDLEDLDALTPGHLLIGGPLGRSQKLSPMRRTLTAQRIGS